MCSYRLFVCNCGRLRSRPVLFVTHNARLLQVHRLILAFSSEYFAEMLERPDTDRRIVLAFPDPDHVFPDIIRFMYTGDVLISAEKAVPLLAMADHYAITELKTELSAYISKNVRRENAVTLLKKALQFHADKVVRQDRRACWIVCLFLR